MSMSVRRAGPCLAAALAVSIAGAGRPAAGADAPESFYAGKQIRLIVSTDAGGAYDSYARLLAQVLRDHIPGNPTIIVQNMPGAGGLKAANYIYNSAPRDGTVIAGTHSSIPTGPLTAPAAALYDVNRLSWIGSITSDPYVGYVWHTAPIQRLEDAKTTEVVMGGMAVGTAGTDLSILAKEMFGLKLKIITGYKASTDVKLALEKGEVQGTFANGWASLRSADQELLTEHKVRIIVQHGFTRLADLPDVPSIFDFAKTEADREALSFMLARQAAAKPYFGPPDIPPGRLAMLRQAFDATVRDPKFVDLATRANLTLDSPMTGAELAALAARLSQTPRAVIERVDRMLSNFNR